MRAALDTLIAGMANADLLVMVNTWRTSGAPLVSGTYGSSSPSGAVASGDTVHAVGASLSGLSANTADHYRAVATSANGTTIGPEPLFTTSLGGAPVVIIPPDIGR